MGLTVGRNVGRNRRVGTAVGTAVDTRIDDAAGVADVADGRRVGDKEDLTAGATDGFEVGFALVALVGLEVSLKDGDTDGLKEGITVGIFVGAGVGSLKDKTGIINFRSNPTSIEPNPDAGSQPVVAV